MVYKTAFKTFPLILFLPTFNSSYQLIAYNYQCIAYNYQCIAYRYQCIAYRYQFLAYRYLSFDLIIKLIIRLLTLALGNSVTTAQARSMMVVTDPSDPPFSPLIVIGHLCYQGKKMSSQSLRLLTCGMKVFGVFSFC